MVKKLRTNCSQKRFTDYFAVETKEAAIEAENKAFIMKKYKVVREQKVASLFPES
jgi:hypothetical protein